METVAWRHRTAVFYSEDSLSFFYPKSDSSCKHLSTLIHRLHFAGQCFLINCSLISSVYFSSLQIFEGTYPWNLNQTYCHWDSLCSRCCEDGSKSQSKELQPSKCWSQFALELFRTHKAHCCLLSTILQVTKLITWTLHSTLKSKYESMSWSFRY